MPAGLDGKGLKEVPGVRDLTDGNLMGMLTDDRVKQTIRMGKPPTMIWPHSSLARVTS